MDGEEQLVCNYFAINYAVQVFYFDLNKVVFNNILLFYLHIIILQKLSEVNFKSKDPQTLYHLLFSKEENILWRSCDALYNYSLVGKLFVH